MNKFDTAIKWSRASIEKEDLNVLLPLIDKIDPKHILEIGAWRGLSANMWLLAFKPERFITIEKESSDKVEAIRIPDHLGWQMWYESDSHDQRVLDTVKIYMPVVDFLFIDGDHSYEGVKKDWEMYGPLVRKGGIVAFHDIAIHVDPTEQVDLLWKEVKDGYNSVEIKESPNSTGIGVLFI